MNQVPARVWVLRVALVGLVLLGLQTTITTELRPFGVVVQLMLAFAASAGAASGPGEGALAGFVLGIMYDLATGTPIGATALALAVGGYAAGWGRQYRIEPKWWILAGFTSFGAVVGETMVPLVRVLIGETGLFGDRLLIVLPVVGVSTALLSIVLIPVARWALLVRPSEIRVQSADA